MDKEKISKQFKILKPMLNERTEPQKLSSEIGCSISVYHLLTALSIIFGQLKGMCPSICLNNLYYSNEFILSSKGELYFFSRKHH